MARIKISIAGILSKKKYTAGFTFLELMIVISIMAGFLAFSFPVFQSYTLKNDSGSQLDQLMFLVENLKTIAVREKTDHFLHIDAGTGQVFVSYDDMDEAALDMAKQDALMLSGELRIVDVQFPGSRFALTTGTSHLYRICFRKQGYSDFALIHLEKKDISLTVKIEPFLSKALLVEEYLTLEDCI